MDIGNPTMVAGWDTWLAKFVSDALVAGLASAALALVLWAIIIKMKPEYAPQLVAKAVVSGFLAPAIVVLGSYAARLLGHQDIFSEARFLAVIEVYFKVAWGSGAIVVICNALGIDLNTIIDLLRQLGWAKVQEKPMVPA